MKSFFKYTDPLTLQLEENLFGANGDLATDVVIDRLVENIREATGIQEDDSVPILDVAALLLAMHHHLHEEVFYLQQDTDVIQPVTDNCLDLRRAIGLHAKRIVTRRLAAVANRAVS